MSRLLHGVRSFREGDFVQAKQDFEALANGQSPKALLITCSDSRINPSLITGTRPGDLFVIRNAGNIVPTNNASDGVVATIEYAVVALQVPEIIVCGHSHCGAMKAVLNPGSAEALPAVSRWLEEEAASLREGFPDDSADSVWKVSQLNVRHQLERLGRLPFVSDAVKAGDLSLHGWCYRFESGDVAVLNAQNGVFHCESDLALDDGVGFPTIDGSDTKGMLS